MLTPSRSRSLVRVFGAAMLLATVAACDAGSTSGGEANKAELEAPAPVDEEARHEERVNDLMVIADALEAYHDANGSYPSTDSNWRGIGWGGYKRGDAWIPALVPDYIEELPADPAGGETKQEPQYIYYSDGVGYKLIAHSAYDVQYLDETGRVEIDPIRPERSYGIWTEGFSVY